MTDRIAVLGLGAACIVPGLGLLWKSASLRGDVYTTWAEKVDIAHAGLTERAVRLLRDLQQATDDLLGESGAGFAPDLAVADPAPLAQLAGNFQRTLRARDRLKRRFRTMVALCAATPPLVGAYLAGAAAALSFYADWHHLGWVGVGGLILSGAAIAAGTVVVGGYAYCNWRLTTAEIMSRPDRSHPAAGDDDEQH